MAQRGLVGEFWAYLKARKRWWLMPIILLMAILSLIVVMAQGSALAPFIYSVF